MTTIFVRQGHYAEDPGPMFWYPPPDLTIDRIADFLELDLARGS